MHFQLPVCHGTCLCIGSVYVQGAQHAFSQGSTFSNNCNPSLKGLNTWLSAFTPCSAAGLIVHKVLVFAGYSLKAAYFTKTPLTMRVALMQEEVTAKRGAAEQYLLDSLNLVPDSAGLPAAPWRLLRLSGLAPTASLHQLLPAAWSKEELVKVNPLLSPAAVDRLHEGLMTWLQLCVLEDRLQRVQQALLKQAAGTAEVIKVRSTVADPTT